MKRIPFFNWGLVIFYVTCGSDWLDVATLKSDWLAFRTKEHSGCGGSSQTSNSNCSASKLKRPRSRPVRRRTLVDCSDRRSVQLIERSLVDLLCPCEHIWLLWGYTSIVYFHFFSLPFLSPFYFSFPFFPLCPSVTLFFLPLTCLLLLHHITIHIYTIVFRTLYL